MTKSEDLNCDVHFNVNDVSLLSEEVDNALSFIEEGTEGGYEESLDNSCPKIISDNFSTRKDIWLDAYNFDPLSIRPCVCSDVYIRKSRSTIKSPYTTPTVITEKGEYRGLSLWQQQKDMVGGNIEKFAKNPDYGILLVCEKYLIINVDTDNSAAISYIHDTLSSFYPNLIYSYRHNSKQRTYLFRRIFPLNKSCIAIPGGQLEILGGNTHTLQLYGRHSSGEFIQWSPGLPFREEVPIFNYDEFNRFTARVNTNYFDLGAGSGLQVQPQAAVQKIIDDSVREDLELDEEALFIQDSPSFIRSNINGTFFIKCPRIEKHTTPTLETDTVYFPTGYEDSLDSEVRCSHVSCGSELKKELIRKIKYTPSICSYAFLRELRAVRKRDGRAQIQLTLPNLTKILSKLGYGFAYNSFSESPYLRLPKKRKLIPLVDQHFIDIEHECYRKLELPPMANPSILKRAIMGSCYRLKFDPLLEWANNLVWDGIDRVSDFYVNCLNLPKTHLEGQTYMKYLLSALGARAILRDGQKHPLVDYVVVLCGAQGLGKTTFVKELSPKPQWFSHLDPELSNKEKIHRCIGSFTVELAEMGDLKENTIRGLKSFVSQTTDEYRPLFSNQTIKIPRRYVLIGTSNSSHYLTDHTGNRRWLTLDLTKPINLEYLRENKEQIMAQAVHIAKTEGVLFQYVGKYQRANEYKHFVLDSWTTTIRANLPIEPFKIVRAADIMKNILGLTSSQQTSSKLDRLLRVMKTLRWISLSDAEISEEILKALNVAEGEDLRTIFISPETYQQIKYK